MLHIYCRANRPRSDRMCNKRGSCDAGWAEDPLPSNCPHPESINPAGVVAYRFVNSVPPTPADFYSYEKLGKPSGPKTTPCQRRSVSLVATLDYARRKAGLPSWSQFQLVRLELPDGSGVVRRGSATHVDWWPCASFNAIRASTKVEL